MICTVETLPPMTSPRLEILKTRLKELDAAIAETEKRLPAHSIKPPVMHDLLALEDERDTIREQLGELLSAAGDDQK